MRRKEKRRRRKTKRNLKYREKNGQWYQVPQKETIELKKTPMGFGITRTLVKSVLLEIVIVSQS